MPPAAQRRAKLGLEPWPSDRRFCSSPGGGIPRGEAGGRVVSSTCALQKGSPPRGRQDLLRWTPSAQDGGRSVCSGDASVYSLGLGAVAALGVLPAPTQAFPLPNRCWVASGACMSSPWSATPWGPSMVVERQDFAGISSDVPAWHWTCQRAWLWPQCGEAEGTVLGCEVAWPGAAGRFTAELRGKQGPRYEECRLR